MTVETKPIAEAEHFIVLDHYDSIKQGGDYQTETDLENELIADLEQQGYEYLPALNTPEKLLENLRERIQELNRVTFSDKEWQRFLDEYLDRPNENILDKTRKIHNDHIYDFVFEDGHIQNIYLLDKKNIALNRLQVIHQMKQTGTQTNRYDVTILVNGLPLVQIELKKRGVPIREAFNQIHRYSKESFNGNHSLFKYLQIFIISNGTDTRYFANTTKRDRNSFDFTINWAKADNTPIKDLKDFTRTFLEKNTLLKVLLTYSVFNSQNILMIMRPYQIAATERILQKITSFHHAKTWSRREGGGFVWHTTGSGKTLTSFKTARLATELDFIDKVLFVVDRKDLDTQTMIEYQKFSKDSVSGSVNTAKLKRNLEDDSNRIIVTTIQKLNRLLKSEDHLSVYDKQVVFIFDEAHRSQFGEAQKNIRKKFRKFYQFGFTGTPIFRENTLNEKTTASVFGCELHSYVITDAIRDEKVLKFKVDYHNVKPQFKHLETEQDPQKLINAETRQGLLHPNRIQETTRYILDHFNQKTHRLNANGKGFNAMLAVSSVDAAKLYYDTFKKLQKDRPNPLKVATIFSYENNEEQNAIGDISDENFEPDSMDQSSKEFLKTAIDDYNRQFKCTYGLESKQFQNYYKDIAERVRKQEIDLLIVVGMFLTGFDAPTLNTLFIDKNLRYHGLIQAYSRTNRIYDATKAFGNIVTFRDLEEATKKALILFGNRNNGADDTLSQIVLERGYKDYMDGYKDEKTGKFHPGYKEIVTELKNSFPTPESIETDKDKKDFSKLFGAYLRTSNILQNYDQFATLQAFQNLDLLNPDDLKKFRQHHNLTNQELETMKTVPVLSERESQDYRSTYYDICEQYRGKNNHEQQELDWGDVVFEVDLLKSQEINLDYILGLLFENSKTIQDKSVLIEEAQRLIRANFNYRAKESLIIEFINQTDLNLIPTKAELIDAFFQFAQRKQKEEAEELIISEKLNPQEAKRYITNSLQQGYASLDGKGLHDSLPKMGLLNNNYPTKRNTVFKKISDFITKFKGIGNKI